MHLDITIISRFLNAHSNWIWGSGAMIEKPTQFSELFRLKWTARLPAATNSVTLRVGGEPYSSSTSHFQADEIARQRSDRAQKPKKSWPNPAWKPKILRILPCPQNAKFPLPCPISFSGPSLCTNLCFCMRLDNIIISRILNSHRIWIWGSRIIFEKPTKIYK